ncbi:MAG: replicative DNA helicase, partial [Rhizobiales bacterium]|nr:replicative DNA helicase [Hyphomicrobiales bacterium]
MSFAHALAPEDEPIHRQSPHNIEVEQALLGAILINNEAFYRVSDFLEPAHFYDPLHRQIYEKSSQLIRLGKVADPRTIKSFLKENDRVGEISVAEYLARLAYEATTIINSEDYGRTIYDLSIRRNLITIGEDMVNIAYEAPVDMAPRAQIEDAERR